MMSSTNLLVIKVGQQQSIKLAMSLIEMTILEVVGLMHVSIWTSLW
jgi:hypothetical protein